MEEQNSARATGELMQRVLYEVKRVVVGQDHFLERVLVAILAQGHLLVEGVPGLAKTLTVNTLAKTIRGTFKRIQFTPDLLPADLVGTRMYNQKSGEFSTVLGPVFANLLLVRPGQHVEARFDLALPAVRERGNRRVGAGFEPDGGEGLAGRVGHRVVGVRRPREAHRRPHARLRGEAAVLEHRERHEHVGLLVAAADAEARDRVRRQPGDVAVEEPHRALRGREIAGEQVDERRLAGAVGTDHRVHLAVAAGDRDAIDRRKAAEAPRQRVRLEHHLAR